MGTVQSTHTTSMEIASNEAKSSVSGRKNNEDLVVEEEPTQISNADLDDDSQEAYAEYESSDDDEEEDEEWNERIHILKDARNLSKVADFFLNPHKPVVTVDPYACGRNYFSRPSAAAAEHDSEERELILEEMKQLKQLAVDYMHPEKAVVTSGICARNYFERPSAVVSSEDEEAEARAVLEDAKLLKQYAVDYMCPEKPVVSSIACARNYFTRPSADINEESEAEKELVLKDMLQLKQLAMDYLHPEKPVVTSDAFACGRNYYSRPSADSLEDEDSMDDRDEILEDMKQLKQLAVDYLQPERAVEMDSLSSSRCYFERASAPQQEAAEDADERARIMADAQALKQLAVDYLHPETPVVTSDPYACGRNYFSRPSAEESIEDMEERELILQEMQQLKQLAVDYLHPEKGVKTTGGFACGRNYFSRPSAEGYDERDEEKEMILEEMAQLKKLAVDYLHPEKPIVTDGFASGRNYFSRASVQDYEDEDFMDDRDEILEDMKELKSLAQDYLMPERPVEVDELASCRNYFDRPSAEGFDVDAEERELVLKDMLQLKQLAVDYMLPEKPVRTTNRFACGRNYFSRPSALEYEDSEAAEERELVLEDMRELKQLAVDYLHPEKPVVTSDSFACGRNYFSRPSAEESIEDMEERELILQEMQQLKQLAVDYLHPEKGVKTTDGFACGRNYFSRPSAEEYDEKDEEKEMISEEMAQLKKLAVDYLHPEKPIVTDGLASGRNYFSRASAPEQESLESCEEQANILEEMAMMKKLSADYMYPERAVKSLGGARNYFDRPSASGHSDHIHSEGHSISRTAHDPYSYHDHVLGLVHQEHDDHSHQSEHFDMDEDALQSFRDNLHTTELFKGQHPKEGIIQEEDGTNLSRSPSSIMLFDLATM